MKKYAIASIFSPDELSHTPDELVHYLTSDDEFVPGLRLVPDLATKDNDCHQANAPRTYPPLEYPESKRKVPESILKDEVDLALAKIYGENTSTLIGKRAREAEVLAIKYLKEKGFTDITDLNAQAAKKLITRVPFISPNYNDYSYTLKREIYTLPYDVAGYLDGKKYLFDVKHTSAKNKIVVKNNLCLGENILGVRYTKGNPPLILGVVGYKRLMKRFNTSDRELTIKLDDHMFYDVDQFRAKKVA